LYLVCYLQAKKSGFQKASVLEAKNNENAFSESKFRRDALLGKEQAEMRRNWWMLDVPVSFHVLLAIFNVTFATDSFLLFMSCSSGAVRRRGGDRHPGDRGDIRARRRADAARHARYAT
jgi:hypothetical protein